MPSSYIPTLRVVVNESFSVSFLICVYIHYVVNGGHLQQDVVSDNDGHEY